ncbi:shikimate dehydrogenase [Arsenophonus endosymbiont of Lipoptena cervi]|uniref:shikimate dehydrogenase n=1 Tax=Arsenophonus endosymbiont of Lipoptena cervi TaxID=363258 RepID=UPI00376EFB5B
MEEFALFGNPVMHSKSPLVHKIFSEQTCIKYNYKTILTSLDEFKKKLDHFFYFGGKGANITSPFKEIAYHNVDCLTKYAQLCGSVNTIKKLDRFRLLGSNTDGIGLILDLKRLGFIKKGMHVLIIGAGGAARGAIVPILNYNCRITITNRTFSKANELAQKFSLLGNIQASYINYINSPEYDLIINATSSCIVDEAPVISLNIFNKNVFCYDMFYLINETPFLRLAQNNGVLKYANGIGMLVGQAAFSFKLWFGILPNIINVLKQLNLFYTHSEY